MDNAWEVEARALREINKLQHTHITQCIAAIRRGSRRYFMFPWAGGGSLQDFWESIPNQHPNATMIHQTIEQLWGLADALDTLHHGDDSGNSNDERLIPNITEGRRSVRHGNLEPSNILRFLEQDGTTSVTTQPQLGLLKIADLNLAKQHTVATISGTKSTRQRYGTVRYEAPEATVRLGGRSRLYDIWSMGCIVLEFIIWILHGNETLEDFRAQVEGPSLQACQFYEGNPLQVHHVVTKCISRIRLSDPECSRSSAIRDLLDVVRTRLLVVELDPRPSPARKGSFSSQVHAGDRYRATAAEFRSLLVGILAKAKADPGSYLSTGQSRENVQLPDRSDSL